MRIDASVLMLAALLAAGVTAAATRHADGIWLAVPAGAVLAVALARGRVPWPALALAIPLVAVLVAACKLDPRGWHTSIPICLVWIRLYRLPWSERDAPAPGTARALLAVGVPTLAVAALGTIELQELGRSQGSFPWLVWALCGALALLPFRSLLQGRRSCRPDPAVRALLLLAVGVAACAQWHDTAVAVEERCVANERWALGFTWKIARAQSQLAEANRSLAAILEGVDARSAAGIDTFGPTATVPPYPFDPRTLGLDRDRDGVGEHPTLAALSGDLDSPARHQDPFDIVNESDLERVLNPGDLCLYRGHGYYFLTYLLDETGVWFPERWPAELRALEPPPNTGNVLQWQVRVSTWRPAQADIDNRERGVLVYAWPVTAGRTGHRTLVAGSTPRVHEATPPLGPPYSGLDRIPAPPTGLGR